jgi:uncharacterized protein YndB with AHSA1/START domain
VLPEWLEPTRQGWGKLFDALDELLHSYGELIQPGTIRFERLLPGPVERVWAYLTESDKRAQWLAAGAMELRAGGSLTLHFAQDSLSKAKAPPPPGCQKSCDSQHQVTLWDPPRSLGLTWGQANDPSEVTFELTPQQDRVLLVLTHRRLLDRKTRLGVAAGWHSHLAVLADRLNGREPQAFWTTFTTLQADYEKRLP